MNAIAALCAGLALWCSFGAVGVVGAAGQVRLGLLPPSWLLLLCCGGFYLLLRAARFAGTQALPLVASAVLLLPWLPVPVPDVFLLWTGPLVVPVWLLVLGGTIWQRGVRLRVRQLQHPFSSVALAFGLALALYGVSSRLLAPLLPDGDAPHYLIIAQSLIRDGDIQIEDNHRRGDYLEYSLHASQPDFLRRGVNGAIYSIHAPGLPAVIAPVMWMFGYPGVVAFLGGVSAAGAALAWWLAFRATGSRTAAWAGWACGALTVPFFFQATQVFPDGMAATLLLVGMLPALRADALSPLPAAPSADHANRSVWIVAGCALALLPWLQTRLAILAVAATSCLLARRPSAKTLVAFAAAPVISAIAWFAFFYNVYGTPNPAAPYGSYTQTALANLPRGLAGILLDQQFGLLPNAPVYGVLIAGVLAAAVRGKRWSLELLVLALPYVAAVGMYEHWWGGASVAARFLTPLSLVCAVGAARLWHGAANIATRVILAGALAASVFVSAVLLFGADGRLLINFRDGIALWMEWMNGTLALPRAFPSLFVDTPAGAVLKAAIGTAIIVAAWAILLLLERQSGVGPDRAVAAGAARHAGGGRTSPGNSEPEVAVGAQVDTVHAWTVAGACAVVLFMPMVALAAMWSLGGGAPLTPARSEMHLLDASASEWRTLGVDLTGRTLLAPEDLRTRLRIRPDDLRPRATRSVLLSARSIPAGDYRVDVSSSKPLAGTLTVRAGDTTLPFAVVVPANGTIPDVRLRFPVALQSLAVEGDGGAVDAIESLALAPVAADRSPVASRPPARRAAAYRFATIYFRDDNAFPEATGFWVAGGRSADVVLSSAAGPLRLLLRNAPVDNLVTIDLDGQRHEVPLGPDEEKTITLPRSAAVSSIQIAAPGGFRPSEREPGNKDFRHLGVWVEVVGDQ